tara:strand:+ start:991 stop:1491 length:501 start_codon:yes stop_codon:yes gene_type:complete
MSYLPSLKSGRLSSYILGNVLNQITSSTSYVNYQITSTITTVVNHFNTTLVASAASDRVTLPAGKYYLNARLTVKRAVVDVWGVEYIFYSYINNVKTEIGYEGKEAGSVAITDPQKSEHATAYIESDGTVEIGLQFKTTNGVQVVVSDTTYQSYVGQSRVMIWRIE